MKKIIAFGIILLIILTAIVSCKKEPVTLESIKNALTDAGYAIEDSEEINFLITGFYENSRGGFTFTYPGAHGDKIIPVIEFKDKESAGAFAKIVNETEYQEAIVNDKFATIYDSDGHNHGNEKTFLENLINGKSIK